MHRKLLHKLKARFFENTSYIALCFQSYDHRTVWYIYVSQMDGDVMKESVCFIPVMLTRNLTHRAIVTSYDTGMLASI